MLRSRLPIADDSAPRPAGANGPVQGPAYTRIAEINIGKVCNTDCAFCMTGDPVAAEWKFASLDWIRGILATRREAGFEAVTFLGGEPTAHPKLTEAVAIAKALGFLRIAITTNGVRLDDATFVRRLIEAGLNRVSLSIHSDLPEIEDELTRGSGNFARKLAGIRNLMPYYQGGALAQGVGYNAVLTTRLVDRMDAFVRFAAATGCRDVRFNIIRPQGRTQNNHSLVPPYSAVTRGIAAAWRETQAHPGLHLTFGDAPWCIYPPEMAATPGLLARVSGEAYDRPQYVAEFKGPGRDESHFSWHDARRFEQKTRIPACATCEHVNSCEGVWQDYLDIHGPEGLPQTPAAAPGGGPWAPEIQTAVARALTGRWAGTPYEALTNIGGTPADALVQGFDPELYLLQQGRKLAVFKENLRPEAAQELARALREAGFATAVRPGETASAAVIARDAETLAHTQTLLGQVFGPSTPHHLRQEAQASLGRLLGYPDCCIRFFLGFGEAGDNGLWLRRSHAASTRGIDPRLIPYPFAAISHVPCSLHCAPSVSLARTVWDGLRTHLGEAHAADFARLETAQAQPLVFGDLTHWARVPPDASGSVPDDPARVAPIVLEPRAEGPFTAALTVALLVLRPGREGFLAADFLESLAGALHDRGISFRLLEVDIGDSLPQAAGALKKVWAQMPGIHAVIFDRPPPRVLVDAGRKALPEAKFFAQATEACETGQGLDAIFSCVDLRSTLQALDALRLPAQAPAPAVDLRTLTRAKGTYVFPRPRPYLLAAAGTPAAIRKMAWHDPSCPYREGRTFDSCNFCASPHILLGPEPQGDAAEALAGHIRYLQERLPALREVVVFDQRLLGFIGAFVEALRGRVTGPIDLLFQARVDELLAHQAGLGTAVRALPTGARLHLYLTGFENFSATELKRLGKGVTPEQNSAAIEAMDALAAGSGGRFLFRERGAHGFILFNPWTTPETLAENLPYLRRHRFHELRHDALVTRLRLLPGLPLYQRAQHEGLFDDAAQEAVGTEAFFRGYSPPRAWRFAHAATARIWEAVMAAAPGIPRGGEADALERILEGKPVAVAPKLRVASSGPGPEAGQPAGRKPRRGASRQVLLIQPPAQFDLDDAALPTTYTGMGILACQAFLEQHGFSAPVLHLGRIRGRRARMDALREQLAAKPTLAAVGMNWVHMAVGAIETAEALRALGHAGPIAVGGQHASMFAEDIAGRYGGVFDAVLTGDAEGALWELAENGVPAKNGRALVMGPTGRNPALEDLPMVSYRGVFPHWDDPLAALSAVRGFCPRKCTYCLESGATRRETSGPIAARPAEALAEQIARFVHEGKDIITIQDPYFRFGDAPVIALQQELLRRRIRLREFNLFTEPSAYTEAGFDAIAAMPAEHITLDFGIESGAPEVLRLAHRPHNLDRMLTEMEAAARRGILVYTWWMTGLPGDTPATIRATAAFIRRTMRAGIVPRWVTPTVVFPGTPIAQDPDKYGVRPRLRTFEDFWVFSTTPHNRFGAYPELITHDLDGMTGEQMIAFALALKNFVREHAGDLELAGQRSAPVREALGRRTQMLTARPDENFDMASFF